MLFFIQGKYFFPLMDIIFLLNLRSEHKQEKKKHQKMTFLGLVYSSSF